MLQIHEPLDSVFNCMTKIRHCTGEKKKMQERISSENVWLELRLPAESIEATVFARLCKSLSSVGTALQTDAKIGDAEHVAWFTVGDNPQRMRTSIVVAAMLFGVPQADICLNALGDDWETAWQKNWKAMPIGKRLWIRPSFCDPPTDDRLDIVLDPGMAFGTGQHATTQLCLKAIERICNRNMPATMLDMGAGSGILSIAAAKLGVKQVLAMDNDPTAVKACKINAAINGVEIESVLDGIPPGQTFDVVVANILANPLIDMAPTLAKCVGRSLVLSGLLATQVNDVGKEYVDTGLTIVRTDMQEEWAAMELKR